MEKFSQWRDPATGIHPFVQARTSISPLALLAVVRAPLLGVIALVHILLDGLFTLLTPIPPLHRLVTSLLTAFTCRLALGIMGFYWIKAETASAKRGGQGIAQAVREPRKGDLIVANWTSYVDVLYLAFRYNPIFLLPVFAPAPVAEKALTGRHTGTGSAQISMVLPRPSLLGYQAYSLFGMLRRTGSLPETLTTPPMYKTLREARRHGLVCLFPEGTTSNGRALLKIPEGVLGDGEIGMEGVIWVKYLKSSACPYNPLSNLFNLLSSPSNSLTVRTLHPSNAPSSPSFLPSEILASSGLDKIDEKSAWKEAVAAVLAETGRVRRVKMGWVEKGTFLEYMRARK